MTVGPGAASVPANGGAQIFDNFDPGDPARIFLGRRGFLVFDAKPPVWAGPIPGRRRRYGIPVVPTGSGCPLAPMLENKLRLSLTEVIVSPKKSASLPWCAGSHVNIQRRNSKMPTPILSKESLIPGKTSKLVLEAPQIAGKARPGHFVILRMNEKGERIPLTIADTDPEKGTITIVYLVMGKSTAVLESLNAGDAILDVCGPLGRATHIEKRGTVVCVGGGTGIAAMHHIAKGHSRIGNRVVGIIGARSKDLLLFEKELKSFVDELLISTDDGSYGHKGLVTELLKDRLEKDREVFEVVAVGPVPMMSAVAETTRPFGVKTTVSLNPVMVDGIGMCGACRVTVGGETRFACVDGPEFDGHQVDFAELRRRLGAFREQETQSLELWRCSCHGNK